VTRTRTLLIVLFAALLVLMAERAEGAGLPINLQAGLLAKVAGYDRNFRQRAGDRALVLLVVKRGDSDSAAVASQMKAALARLPAIGGLPHDEITYEYSRPQALAETVEKRGIAIVVLGPGFQGDIDGIRAAVSDLNLMTVATEPDYVPHGIVLGFDVVSGRPKILVHLTQARQQQVQLRADVLKLMQVYK
jgi:hypothetical protein